MAHVDAALEGLIAPRRRLFRSSLLPVASTNSPRSFLHSSSSLSRSTWNTPSILDPCFLPACLHPLSRLSMRTHQLPALNGRHVAAISLSTRYLLRTGKLKKRGQKGVPGRAKKNARRPRTPQHNLLRPSYPNINVDGPGPVH